MTQHTVLPGDVLLLSFDLTHGDDNRICLVAKKNEGNEFVTIVNAFAGQQAEDIYRLLTTVTKKEEEESNV